MKLLVDADLLVYRCGFAAESRTYIVHYRDRDFDEDVSIRCDNMTAARNLADRITEEQATTVRIESVHHVEPEVHALSNIKNMMDDICGTLEGEPLVVLSGEGNFRHSIATIKPYKGNRDPDHKPVHGPAIKRYLERHYETVYTENEEADDYCGYTQCAMGPDESVIVTVDKDLNMIPGLHYNFLQSRLFNVEMDEADRFFWYQMVTGDAVDNIPGVPGMGPAKAAKLLDDVPTAQLPGAVAAAYVTGYGERFESALLENGRLLWIRRVKGELWQPPKF